MRAGGSTRGGDGRVASVVATRLPEGGMSRMTALDF
jgi:hypothetical protein